MNILLDKEKTTRQHFVPVFYLKNFYHNNQAFWVYEKNSGKIYESNANGICYKNNLYETEDSGILSDGKYILTNLIENQLSDVDGKNATFIKGIITRLSSQNSTNALILNASEVRETYEFINNLIVRHPIAMSNFLTDEKYKLAYENNKNTNLIKDLFEMLGFGDPESFMKVSFKNTYFDSKGKGVSYINYFETMHHVFLKATNASFITSDFPVRMDLNYENRTFNSIYLPLSSDYAVCLGSKRSSNRNRIVSLNKEMVNNLNKYVLIDGFNTKVVSNSKEQLEDLIKSVNIEHN